MRRLEIEPVAYFAAAAGLLLLPLHAFLAVAAAASFHELCHYLAAKVMGIPVYRITIRIIGCRMETQWMTPGQELLCAAAGPAGSLLLMVFAKKWPLLALCGAVQGCFNLLPVYPMDGGRMIYCAVSLMAGERTAAALIQWAGKITVVMILCLSVYLTIALKWGVLPILSGIIAGLRIGKVKNSLQTGATQGTIELPFSKR